MIQIQDSQPKDHVRSNVFFKRVGSREKVYFRWHSIVRHWGEPRQGLEAEAVEEGCKMAGTLAFAKGVYLYPPGAHAHTGTTHRELGSPTAGTKQDNVSGTCP